MTQRPVSKRMKLMVATGLALLMAIGLVWMVPSAARAADEPVLDEGSGAGVNASATTSWSKGELEVGVHYMGDYGGNGDLPNSKSNGYGFYNTLRYHPYTIFGLPRWCDFSGQDCYIWGDASAWERDWVDNNDAYVDDVDVVYYQGHGWPGGFTLNAPDDKYVQYGEVQGKWGNRDLEWAFLNTCSVLANSHLSDWHGTMDGMHGIASFSTTSYNTAGFGSALATYIVFGYSYKDAWFKTCDAKQPSGVQAQIIVEDYSSTNASRNYFAESAYNQLSDPVHDGVYWYWRKWCGAPTSGHLSAAQLDGTFPVYQTPPLGLEEQEQNWNHLTDAFQFQGMARSGAATQVDIGGTRIISDTEGRQLEVDMDTGLFYYYDANRTFADPATQGRSSNRVLSPTDAKDIADQFLRDNGILPTDAVFNTVDDVKLGSAGQTNAAGIAEVNETTTGYEVIYSRYLTAPGAAGADGTSAVQIPVDGPGAKVKVYVDPTAVPAARLATRANQTGAVVGAQGGWRQVENQGSRMPAQVDLLDYETQILPMFQNNELESMVTYDNVPFPDADSKQVISYTVSGWEESNGESQDMIYPAYRIEAEYGQTVTLAGGVTETVAYSGFSWIAANPQFMRPLAKFESLPDQEQNYTMGDTITATAVDASRTLADLGYDTGNSNLDFALGAATADDYLYKWFLGDVENGKSIGNGRTLNYTLDSQDTLGLKGAPAALEITLQVVNSASSHTSMNTSTRTFTINAVSPLYIPLISK